MRTCLKLLCFIPVILICSCGEYPCGKADIPFALVGFSNAETDTIILKRFAKNNGILVDSFFFDESDPVRFSRKNDTLLMTAYPSTVLLQTDFDYQVNFPGAGKLFTITDITEQQRYGKKRLFNNAQPFCGNSISSYAVNGVTTDLTGRQSIIYLSR